MGQNKELWDISHQQGPSWDPVATSRDHLDILQVIQGLFRDLSALTQLHHLQDHSWAQGDLMGLTWAPEDPLEYTWGLEGPLVYTWGQEGRVPSYPQ